LGWWELIGFIAAPHLLAPPKSVSPATPAPQRQGDQRRAVAALRQAWLTALAEEQVLAIRATSLTRGGPERRIAAAACTEWRRRVDRAWARYLAALQESPGSGC
jgi:hypothetical protein